MGRIEHSVLHQEREFSVGVSQSITAFGLFCARLQKPQRHGPNSAKQIEQKRVWRTKVNDKDRRIAQQSAPDHSILIHVKNIKLPVAVRQIQRNSGLSLRRSIAHFGHGVFKPVR